MNYKKMAGEIYVISYCIFIHRHLIKYNFTLTLEGILVEICFEKTYILNSGKL